MPSRHIYTGPTSPSSWESNARAARHCATHSTQPQALCTIIPPPVRIRFADPDEDDKRRHEEEAQVDAEEQELAARRMFNEAYLQRMGRPQAFGLG